MITALLLIYIPKSITAIVAFFLVVHIYKFGRYAFYSFFCGDSEMVKKRKKEEEEIENEQQGDEEKATTSEKWQED